MAALAQPSWTVLGKSMMSLDGEHGFHEVGLCEGPSFASAKGHFNPHGRKHGRESPDGAHVGDLPNMILGHDPPVPIAFLLQQLNQRSKDRTDEKRKRQ